VMACVVYFDDFKAAVKQDDFEAVVLRNDDDARRRIAEALDGVELYFHAGPHFGEEYVWVTLAELICHRIISRVTLHKDE